MIAECENYNYICKNDIFNYLMIKEVKYPLYFVLSTMAYTFVFTFFYCWMKYGEISPLLDVDVFLTSLFFNFVPTCGLALINWLIVFKIKITNNTVAKILFDVILSALVLVAINHAFVAIVKHPVNMGGTVFNDAMLLMIVEIIYFSRKYGDSIRREAIVSQENLQYKYEVLKAQIDPHFLFNSLNILYSLISLDRQKSRDFVLSLSDIYRYVMTQENKNRIHISEELQFLESYISILRIRYDGCFNVEIHRSNENLDMAMIIPFTLQLLIENAIKHNEISSRNNLSVIIDIDASGIKVSNQIVPRQAETVSRIGLRYLSQLYALHNKYFYTETKNERFIAHVPYL